MILIKQMNTLLEAPQSTNVEMNYFKASMDNQNTNKATRLNDSKNRDR